MKRYHNVGILVVFLHDVTDVILEFTKCNVYAKNRNGKFNTYNDYVANLGFVSFAIAWFVFRLYWYPLKVLYSSGVVAAHRAYIRGAGLYTFFNSLLWLLLFLDIYWFYVR
jgi:sphingoid base N-stearoyltransferase